MAWLRLDDGFAEHPKIVGLSDAAFRLHVTTLCYCARRLTDGFVPAGLVGKAAARPVRELLEHGCWTVTEGGYAVHDFLDWNPTRTDVEGSREQARERMRDVRTNNDGSSDNPVPVPISTKKQVLHLRSIFDDFWAFYPRKIGKRTAESAFLRASQRGDPDAIVQGAQRLALDPNLPEPRFIPHPTTWLNRDGWQDEACPPRTNGRAASVGNILAMAERIERDQA